MEIKVHGQYQHYKGGKYEVVGLGKDSETLVDVVIYCPLYESNVSLWVRPKEEFVSSVVVDGKEQPRFLLIA
ncbi:MAG TPA: DUF1653 domain-containing protein [Patescibacteria group bacterium]|nr:DUF1653 domain-containing protein [Patescibacteria group bacterium]